MLFSCLPTGIEHRFIDLSCQAVESAYFPTSVGLRSQALKLQFVSPESEGRFLQPVLPLRKALRIYEKRFNTMMSNPTFHKVFIGETISLIYSPFYVGSKLYDGILDKPISSILPSNFETSLSTEKRPGQYLRFIPALCPDCGWDLNGRAESIVLNCLNCNSMWLSTGNGLKKLKFGYIPGKESNNVYLPFWRINADITGIKLQTYSDLVKVANLPKAVQKNWNDIEFNFWALAFKVRPQNFVRIAQQITFKQPQEISFSKISHADHYPVTLPMEEAAQSLKISLASFMKPKDFILSELQNIKIRPKKILLVYIAFQENHHELIHSEFHVSINKNMLSLAGNL
ncbi:MAG: hypothetical protein JW786_00905 [Desulfobacterales bacterium]|nr:hypothetical protein [Desulfobacterales bacterium]